MQEPDIDGRAIGRGPDGIHYEISGYTAATRVRRLQPTVRDASRPPQTSDEIRAALAADGAAPAGRKAYRVYADRLSTASTTA
ncbi:hypothetical protein ACI2LJ_30845 [Streptomyces sp. NPDC088090]